MAEARTVARRSRVARQDLWDFVFDDVGACSWVVPRRRHWSDLAHGALELAQSITTAQAFEQRPVGPTVVPVTRYRFLDGMGDLVAEGDFADHTEALAWAMDDDGPEEEVQRVEYLGPEGDWRWAGALHG